MRVAFSVFGGAHWIGGTNYLRNLLAALNDLPSRRVSSILFHSPDTDRKVLESLLPYIEVEPVCVEGWDSRLRSRALRMMGATLLQSDFVSERVFRSCGIDVVFQHGAWYGFRFPIPTLAWLADFQHCHLPEMFTLVHRARRNIGYSAIAKSATRILVSSNAALADCEQFIPSSRGRISVLPFSVTIPRGAISVSATFVKKKYRLPDKYFFMPNQLWRHKNHIAVLDAMLLLRDRGCHIEVVASGNPRDDRNPDYPINLLAKVQEYGLDDHFRFLGLVAYEDVIGLLRGAVAVINPSLFEGWSTTVEEAKALGVPLLVSDLRVHREQVGGRGQYFDPRSPTSIAECLFQAWRELPCARSEERETLAAVPHEVRRREFARSFVEILEETIRCNRAM